MSTGHVVAVDIGGTHTDAVLLRADGTLVVHKVPSTPADPGAALLTALDGLLAKSDARLDDVAAIVHGTTVATNAVITGDYARVGLLVTAGFEDVLEIATQQRPDLYDPWRPKPAPLVPRDRVHGVRERVAPDGTTVLPIHEDDVRAAGRALRDRVDAVAVSLLFSFADPTHERRAAKLLAAELPGVPITISSVVAPEFREYPRTTTTTLNAALLPRTGGYITRLRQQLIDSGFRGVFRLMTSNGGVVPAESAMHLPVSLLVSGPAAAAVAAAGIGRALRISDLVMLDVGGTSADVAVIADGMPQRRYRGEVAGMPIAAPQIDVLPIGAGGGSLARVDDFGSLRVGPQSAGADPGPAAYGRDTRATVTDAHIVRGTLEPMALLGGALPLHPERAVEAVSVHVADPLGLDPVRGAAAAIRVVNGTMADAIRAVTVSRGLDPRSHALIAFGGAGPLHACEIADLLGMRQVVVPRFPGLTSALGLLMGEQRFDVSRTIAQPLRRVDLDRLAGVLATAADEASRMLDANSAVLGLDVDLRYAGQAYELTVPVGDTLGLTATDIPVLEERFFRAHEAMYGHAWSDVPVELVTVRVRARIAHPPMKWVAEKETGEGDAPRSRIGTDPTGERSVHAVVERPGVAAGLAGPAIVSQTDTTTLIPAGWVVTRTEAVGMVLERTPR